VKVEEEFKQLRKSFYATSFEKKAGILTLLSFFLPSAQTKASILEYWLLWDWYKLHYSSKW
jgi:hypothetical protein